MLGEVRRQAKALNPDCLLTTEGICENFIPWLDLYDQRAGNMEYFGHWGAGQPMGGEAIPLFGYVYSGYIGAYLAAMPECNRPEVRYWTLCLGRTLAQGVVPTTGRYFPKPAGLNPVTLGFYGKVVRAARACWPYIMFGEMLRPPAIAVPAVTASYLKFVLVSDRHEMDPNQRHEVTAAAVQHSAWRAADGSLAWIFANVSDAPVRFDVDLSPAGGPKAGWTLTRNTDGKRRALRRAAALPLKTRLSMPPLSVTIIEATRER